MTHGYIYCFSNPSYEGILKVGMTERTPEDRTKELFKTGVPTPFKIEFAKKVENPKQKEILIHGILTYYHERVNSNREFFRVSPEQVKKFFELIDGEWWVENPKEENQSIISKSQPCRDMNKCFKDGQRIRHTIDGKKTWTGTYYSSKNEINHEGKIYQGLSPLNQFAKSHYKIERPDRTPECNAWKECECEEKGIWKTTYDLPLIE